MVWKQPLVSMVSPMVFGLSTIGPDGFLDWQPLGSMVFGLVTIGLDGFSMVANHWSNDGMVTIYRYGLTRGFCDEDEPDEELGFLVVGLEGSSDHRPIVLNQTKPLETRTMKSQ